jgi:hypothetical protein
VLDEVRVSFVAEKGRERVSVLPGKGIVTTFYTIMYYKTRSLVLIPILYNQLNASYITNCLLCPIGIDYMIYS